MNSKEALKLACKECGIKEIAENLMISPSAIYNQINDPQKKDILSKFVDFVNACNNDIPIQWVSSELNGMFIKNPDIQAKKEEISENCIPESLHNFGNVIQEIGQAMEDGKVTPAEAESIREKWEKLKVILETFVLACEYGFLDQKDEKE